MDFRTQSASLDALAGINADALIVVIAGEALPAKLDKAVADAAKDAIKLGDFELKAGKTLLVQRAPGVKSARLVLAAAGQASLKSAKAAVAAALGLVKARNAAHAAVMYVGFDGLDEALAEQTALAAADAVYTYRHTKPVSYTHLTLPTIYAV